MMTARRSPALPSHSDAVLELLQQELCNDECTDRAAKFQVFCEKFWDRLQLDPAPANSTFDRFVAMLQHDENILLAQLVLPDLRPNAIAPSNHMKQRVLDRISIWRTSPDCSGQQPQQRTNNSEAHRLYAQEKQVLHEADLHRVCILLYGRGNMDDRQRDDVREWLARYPRQGAKIAQR